jgi:hypothetical protein
LAIPGDLLAHYRLAERVARTILDRGALLMTTGGAHRVPVAVFRTTLRRTLSGSVADRPLGGCLTQSAASWFLGAPRV